MRIHLVIDYGPGRMWDAIHISATERDSQIDWYHRDVFVGQDWNIALNKAQVELETLLVKLGVMQPGLTSTTLEQDSLSDLGAGAGSRSEPRPAGQRRPWGRSGR